MVDDCSIALKLLYDKLVKMLELNSGDHFQSPSNGANRTIVSCDIQNLFSKKEKV